MTDLVAEPQQKVRGSLPDAPLTMPVQRLEAEQPRRPLMQWLTELGPRRTSGEA